MRKPERTKLWEERLVGVWCLSDLGGRFHCQDFMAVPSGDMDQVLVLL